MTDANQNYEIAARDRDAPFHTHGVIMIDDEAFSIVVYDNIDQDSPSGAELIFCGEGTAWAIRAHRVWIKSDQ